MPALGVLRRWAPVVVAVLTVIGLMMAALDAGRHVPAQRVLDPLPARDTVDASLAGAPTFTPMRTAFVAEVLGDNLRNFIVVPADDVAGDGSGSLPRAPRTDRTAPPTPGGDTQGPRGAGILGTPVFRFARLEVTMDARPATVEAGQHISYRIVVTNTGTGDFDGEVSLTSHHPFGTTDSSTPCGDDVGVRPDPDDPCVAPAAPVPGVPSEDVHTVQFSYAGPIPQGSQQIFEFRVRVHPATPSGTEIDNHAHLDVVGDAEPAVTSNQVRVRVR